MPEQHPLRPAFGVVSGLEYQRAIADGVIPTQPFQTLLGFHLRSVDDDGTVVGDAIPHAEFANSAGRLHGGYLSALMDCATATAAHSRQPVGAGAPHIHASYRFLSSADHRSALVITARPSHVGRSVVHAAVEIRTRAGRLIASGETIHKVRRIAAPPDADTAP
ncbi:PaaI family thioesterase [Polymorphospora sp. NPDC051019]|uniref:PaaI family thioesterase n=1 Tax=Polymorphospora sp. NPDC051019 TaxID=3155725 RepID=UPI00343E943D